MNPIQHSHPLGILRPRNQHQTHHLKITLLNADGQPAWSTILDLDTQPESARKFIVFELSSALRPPGGLMRQHADEHSELLVPLAGVVRLPVVQDLSAQPLHEWMPTMFATFARCPAAIAVLVNQGRVSTILNGEYE